MAQSEDKTKCSFCSKDGSEVTRLIQGPHVLSVMSAFNYAMTSLQKTSKRAKSFRGMDPFQNQKRLRRS